MSTRIPVNSSDRGHHGGEDIPLTPRQRYCLQHAIDHTGGWVIAEADAGQSAQAMTALARLGLIRVGLIGCCQADARVTAAAYRALGRAEPAGAVIPPPQSGGALVRALGVLLRPEGATRAQVRAVTGWPARLIRPAIFNLADTFGLTLSASATTGATGGGTGIKRIYCATPLPVARRTVVIQAMSTQQPDFSRRDQQFDLYLNAEYVATCLDITAALALKARLERVSDEASSLAA